MPCRDCTDEARCDRAGVCQLFDLAPFPGSKPGALSDVQLQALRDAARALADHVPTAQRVIFDAGPAASLWEVLDPAHRRRASSVDEAFQTFTGLMSLLRAAGGEAEPYQVPKNDATDMILGSLPWTTAYAAVVLRNGGHAMPEKLESEQAYVLRWLLNLYIAHGDQWKELSEAELRNCASVKRES